MIVHPQFWVSYVQIDPFIAKKIQPVIYCTCVGGLLYLVCAGIQIEMFKSTTLTSKSTTLKNDGLNGYYLDMGMQ